MKTRNKLLLFVAILVIAYTIVDIILGFCTATDGIAAQLDSTLTEQVFSFARWTVTTGAAITITKTIKGEDGDEPPFPDGEEEDSDDEPKG